MGISAERCSLTLCRRVRSADSRWRNSPRRYVYTASGSHIRCRHKGAHHGALHVTAATAVPVRSARSLAIASANCSVRPVARRPVCRLRDGPSVIDAKPYTHVALHDQSAVAVYDHGSSVAGQHRSRYRTGGRDRQPQPAARLRVQSRRQHRVGHSHGRPRGDCHGRRRQSPDGVAISPTQPRAYVANFGGNTVTVFDTGNHAVLASVNVGNNPSGSSPSHQPVTGCLWPTAATAPSRWLTPPATW